MDEIDAALQDWYERLDKKTDEIIDYYDKGILKAAIFCEGEAKKNAMNAIYNTPVPFNDYGEDMWERTGLTKASIGSGINPDKPHSAVIFCNTPYAKYLEYGTGIFAVNGDGRKTPWVFNSNLGNKIWTQGIKPRPFMWPAIANNKEQIKKIIKDYIKEVV